LRLFTRTGLYQIRVEAYILKTVMSCTQGRAEVLFVARLSLLSSRGCTYRQEMCEGVMKGKKEMRGKKKSKRGEKEK